MCRLLLLCSLMHFCTVSYSQLYFPPNGSAIWDTIQPSSLGWCNDNIDSLYAFLDTSNTKAFILLKDGKIVLEQYFDGHTSSSNWYWASAGKTLSAFAIGLAQEDGYLSINDTSSSYLGKPWTTCPSNKEDQITIWHQLTMTTGLNDQVADPDCTLDTCLQYLADAGTRWSYHNGPYTLLDDIIEQASGQTLNSFISNRITGPIGMNGSFLPLGYLRVFFSNARSMARFGLLVLNQGNWNGTTIMNDTTYFNQMVNTSQNINPAYGYLWWLNGKNQFMVPGLQFQFNVSLCPNAPADMFAALGKNGQFINVVPSENLVWIRMGDNPSNSLVPFTLNDQIWTYINQLPCSTSNISTHQKNPSIRLYPNPSDQYLTLETKRFDDQDIDYSIYNQLGQLQSHGCFIKSTTINIHELPRGNYFIRFKHKRFHQTSSFIKE